CKFHASKIRSLVGTQLQGKHCPVLGFTMVGWVYLMVPSCIVVRQVPQSPNRQPELISISFASANSSIEVNRLSHWNVLPDLQNLMVRISAFVPLLDGKTCSVVALSRSEWKDSV